MVLNTRKTNPWRYEHRGEPPIHRQEFIQRLLRNGGLAVAIVCVSLAIGVSGYHWIAGLPWVDSFLNASMILGGMGQVDVLKTPGAKIFAACYALYAGMIILFVAAVLFTLGILGIFLNRKNVIVILMCVELMLLAVNINLVAFSVFQGNVVGQIFAMLVLTVAAAEAAIGLAILVVYFRNRGTIEVEDINAMKG